MKKLLAGACVALLLAAGVVVFLKYDEWFVFPGMRAHVLRGLKDPESAQFRNERLTKAGWLCGEVNAKNSMGGYVGFKRFASGSETDAYLEGYGYVGSEKSTDLVLQEMTIRNELLRRYIETLKTSGSSQRPTEQEINEEVTSDLFERKWKEVCA